MTHWTAASGAFVVAPRSDDHVHEHAGLRLIGSIELDDLSESAHPFGMTPATKKCVAIGLKGEQPEPLARIGRSEFGVLTGHEAIVPRKAELLGRQGQALAGVNLRLAESVLIQSITILGHQNGHVHRRDALCPRELLFGLPLVVPTQPCSAERSLGNRIEIWVVALFEPRRHLVHRWAGSGAARCWVAHKRARPRKTGAQTGRWWALCFCLVCRVQYASRAARAVLRASLVTLTRLDHLSPNSMSDPDSSQARGAFVRLGAGRQGLVVEVSPGIYLTDDRVLRVVGSGSRRWLNSMLTADLRAPAPDAARYALLLNASAGIVGDAWVVEDAVEQPERLALVLAAMCAERTAAVLETALFNEKIALSFDESVRVVSVQGPRARELLQGFTRTANAYSCARLGVEGLDVWVNVSELEASLTGLLNSAYRLGGKPIDALEWSNARITLGVPQAGVDFDESTSPHEAGLEGRAVSFAKGCFPGQEVVARQRRSGATRQLLQLDVERDERLVPGSIVCGQGGEPLGRITSVASANGPGGCVSALAYLTGAFAVPGAQVFVRERAAEVRAVVGQSWPPSGARGISA